MKNLQRERLLELLADQTLFGLSEEELMEVKNLKKQFPDWEQDVSFELAAAAINLSNLEIKDELPADLRTKIFATADRYFETQEETSKVLNFTPRTNANSSANAVENVSTVVKVEPRRSGSPWQWLGWAFAAAACVALAINIWTTRSNNSPEIVKTPDVIQTPPPELSPEQKRQQLIASAGDAVQLPLTDPKNEKEIVGDIVWSNSQQKGYARFRNLPVNDAARETYQLWIVDETQNAKTPISAGVFDIGATGEVIVPMNAQLQVRKPKAIAVTVEKPGGVVVSKQEKVVALAKV